MLDLSPPETEPQFRPYLFIGALPDKPILDPDEFIRRKNYHQAYIQNVKFILNREGAIAIAGQVDLGAADIRRQPSFNFTLLDAYGNWSIINPFNPEKVYVTYDEAALSFPQDCFVAGKNIILVDTQRKFILNGIDLREWQIIGNEKLSEGGRLAVGERLVFASFENLTDQEKNLLESLFPGKRVIYVPTPQALEIRDKNRHRYHIDQFIGGSLKLKDDRLLIPIDRDYFEKGRQYLPDKITEEDKEIRIVYFPVDCSSYYLLNYFITQRGKFYIGPELAKLLTEAGYGNLISSMIETLPAELPVFEDYQAGMRCKLNLVG